MGMITFQHRGSFNKTEKFLNAAFKRSYLNVLDKYGQIGVDALRAATPKDSGKTADSWDYVIERERDRITISWVNDNVNDHVNIALILQYGHGTGSGGYVRGRDYINPTMQPIFDGMAEEAWKEVVS